MKTADRDALVCRRVLSRGSKSFALAGALLPRHVLNDAAAIYAFCRQADDAIDDAATPALARAAHGTLHRRLLTIAEAPAADALEDPVDRALKRVLTAHDVPLSPLSFLLDGFLWDAEGRTYERLQQTLAYSARVAGSVGVLMARLCGVTEPYVLARAADMGVAMQLVNIARDVGEDARRRRLYLPHQWLVQHGLRPASFLSDPKPHVAIKRSSERLLQIADALFSRSRLALYALPWYARLSFSSAGRIYQDIGRSLRKNDYDNVAGRAHVSLPRKLWLVGHACVADGWKPKTLAQRKRLRRPPLAANESLVASSLPVVMR